MSGLSEQGSEATHEGSNPISVVQDAPRFFALIIGINNYYGPKTKLSGCIPDAKAIQQLLTVDLRVPEDQMIRLHDEYASRANIIKGFRDLQNDKRIQSGDPILIFYSGHGSYAPAPKGWEAGGARIETIVPQDVYELSGKRSKTILPIPDRTISALLDDLAQEKGNNITVVFDCCHSGSGTRTDEQMSGFRSIITDEALPADLDKDIWGGTGGTRGINIAAGFLQKGLRSHVLLAACGQDELAADSADGGLFTQTVLKTIRSRDIKRLTYKDLIKLIPAIKKKDNIQNAQCEGFHQDRFLFDAKAASQTTFFYRVKAEGAGYILDAGAANGVANGASFAVWATPADHDSRKDPLGVLTAAKVGPFTTGLQVPDGGKAFELKEPGYALQVRAGPEATLRVHVASDAPQELRDAVLAAQEQMMSGGDDSAVDLVEREKAQLEVALEGEGVVFLLLDAALSQRGLTRLNGSVELEVEALRRVLSAAAHYYWHLCLGSKNTTILGDTSLGEKLLVEVMVLENVLDRQGFQVHQPLGPNLNVNGVVDVVVDANIKYGYKITNTTGLKLYPWLFVFNHSSFEISELYSPSASGGVLDAALKANQALAIGYGSAGVPPQDFYVDDGQDVEIDVLKFIVTTSPMDYRYVSQPSPFKDIEGGGRGIAPAKVKPIEAWDTVEVEVVLRRK